MSTTHHDRSAAPRPGIDADTQISGLQKSFKQGDRIVHAVQDLDLQIRAGEYVVVLGPSGCGKSTLLRCLAGLETPDAGRISLSGRVVYDSERGVDAKPNRRRVGMVFQNYALWPHLSVERNVAYPLRMQKVAKSERRDRVQDVLKALECDQLSAMLPAQLSGGQQQRVALARALIAQPDILLLDEPLSNLDALLRITLRSELLRLHREFGFTALHITHDQAEALEMGDRVILMREGQIEQMGRPEDVYAKPVSPYAATFLGVRNRLSLTATQGRLEYAGGSVTDGNRLGATASADGQLELFVRTRDTVARPWLDGEADDRSLRLAGTAVQPVLGEGGQRQLIVDVGGESWFAVPAGGASIQPGQKVQVVLDPAQILLYRDGVSVGLD